MSSLHLVDPELTGVLASFPRLEPSEEAIVAMRAMPPPPVEVDPDVAADAHEITVPGLDGDPPVRVMVYRPRGAIGPVPAIVHIHGGGYIGGSPEMNDALNRRYAAELGCAVYSVDYRLAPETVYPGALQDCYAVLLWVFAKAAAEGVDPAKIGVKGESAGGGLAAALALYARDRGEVAVAFQMLSCPMLDDRTVVRSDISPLLGEFIWPPASNAFGWKALLGREPGGEGVEPHAAPGRATDLAGLPPTFINVGALDLFLDEDLEYARRLAHAGVPVELHLYPGGYHGYSMTPEARISKVTMRDGMDALRRWMHG